MNDAFHITSGSVASGLFRQFRERARLRYKYVDQVVAHGSGNSLNGAERNAVFGFGLFELLDGLSRCPHFLAGLTLAKAEGIAHRGDLSAGGARREAPGEFDGSVQLGGS